MLGDYETAVSNLKQVLPFINAVVVIERSNDIVYSIDNWDIKADLGKILSVWASMKPQPILISGEKYLIRTCTSDRLIATSIRKRTHIVGVKDNERIMITLIEPDGIIPFTTVKCSICIPTRESGNEGCKVRQ